MKWTIGSALILGCAISTVSAGDILTKKQRIEQTTEVTQEIMTAFAAAVEARESENLVKMRVKPRLVATEELSSYSYTLKNAVRADYVIASDKHLTARLQCRYVGGTMQLDAVDLFVPWNPQEAHSSRETSLNVMEDGLQALLTAREQSDETRQRVVTAWREGREALFKIGQASGVRDGDTIYRFEVVPAHDSKPPLLHVRVANDMP